MTPHLTLTVEADAGTSINDACQEAIDLANRISICVEFNFNGVTCIAKPRGSAEKLVSEFHEQLEKKDNKTCILMIKDLIKSQFLKGNTSEEDCYIELCVDREWEDTEDLYQTFKADYDAVIESDWWEKVQREQRMNEFLEEHDRTDEREFNLEKSRMVRKYG